MLFSDEPVLSLQTSAISKLGNLDAESLAEMWTVFTKCKTHLENGRRLENLSWRLWYSKAAFGEGSIAPGEHGDAELSDPEGFQTTDDDESEPEASGSSPRRIAVNNTTTAVESESTLRRPPHSELAAARPPLLSRTTGSSVERRSISITGNSLQRMITGLSVDVVPAHKPLHPPIVPPAPSITSASRSAPPTTASLLPPVVPVPPPPAAGDSTRIPLSPRLSSTQSPTRSTLHPPKPKHSPSLLRQSSGPPRSGPTRPTKNAKGSTSRLPALACAVVDEPARVGSSQNIAIPRNFSTASFEPKSYTKGFTFEEPVPVGSIAPPPTPAPVRAKLGSPPPSAMKSSKKSTGKKIFFISSPNSDSEGDSCSPRSGPSTMAGVMRGSTGRGGAQPPDNSLDNDPPPLPRPKVAPVFTEDSWDDEEEEEDDDASSGWGSEYSTESDAPRIAKPERPSALFAKRPSSSANLVESVLQPRPAGLLSQLFHPSFGQEEEGRGSSRTRSSVDLSRGATTRPTLHSSKSAGLLTEQRRTKSFLRGAPVGTEMESDSEGESAVEDEGVEDAESQASTTLINRPPNAPSELARNHRSMMDLAGAYPQTPRTTRRAMLATELSESLRRNLLWERQTRNKVLLHPAVAPSAPPSRPPTAQSFVMPPQPSSASTNGENELRVPHPSPATQTSSPLQPIVRRHTTGTGLYLAAQTGKLAPGLGHSSSEEMSEEEEETQVSKDAYGSAFSHHGLHSHGW